MADPGEQHVHVERRPDGVAVVRLDRPKMNALSGALLDQLAVVAGELGEDPPGAVVVWGGDRIFAAGADINEFITGDGGGVITAEEARAVSTRFRAALDAVAAIPRLTVAAIGGHALGGGCELALACDLRVCADSARVVPSTRSSASSSTATDANPRRTDRRSGP